MSAAQDADLVSHEATFGKGMEEKAATAQHSTAYMAGKFAKQIQAKNLVLTHFSPRYAKPLKSSRYEDAMESLVKNAVEGFESDRVTAARDFYTYHVRSENDDDEFQDEQIEYEQVELDNSQAGNAVSWWFDFILQASSEKKQDYHAMH